MSQRRTPRSSPLAQLVAAALVTAAGSAAAHDPRTTARELTLVLHVDEGKDLSIRWKTLHFNAPNFERAKQREGYLGLLNSTVWGELGSARLDVAVVLGEVTVPAGDYSFGVNFTSDEQFSVVLRAKEGEITRQEWKVPLSTSRGAVSTEYLAFALLATAQPDVLVLEARCGPYSGSASLRIPTLAADHQHPRESPPPTPKGTE